MASILLLLVGSANDQFIFHTKDTASHQNTSNTAFSIGGGQ